MTVAHRLPPLLAVALAGCTLLTGPTVEPTRFYVLTPIALEAPTRATLAIGLGPVRFPGYLDRPQMAVRVDANRIDYLETARWAEVLKDNFSRVLASDLGRLAGIDQVVVFPWYRTQPLAYTVSIEVSRFERQPGDEVALVGRWTLLDGKTAAPLASNLVDLRRPAATPDATASALSEVTAELAEQIADAMARR